MGTFHVPVEVSDLEGRRSEQIEAMVDTGSTYLSLPRPFLEALGVVPYTSDRFVYADGREVECDIGRVRITVGPRSRSSCSPSRGARHCSVPTRSKDCG